MASNNGKGGRGGGSWDDDGALPPDIEELFNRGRSQIKQIRPPAGSSGLIAILLIGLALFGIWTAYYTVPSDSVGVVQRFGKYLKEVPPGLHFKIPLGIDIATIVPVKRQLKQEFGFATPGAKDEYQTTRDGKRETEMVTGISIQRLSNGLCNTVYRIR